jgi:hypothetical protein
VWRSRARRADRDAAYATVSRGEIVQPEEIHEEPDPNHQQPLDEWLREVYLFAKRTITEKRHRQGRRFHNVAQEVACSLLMDKLRLSERGAAHLFSDRKDLQAAVRFLHPPHHSWFGRCREVAALYLSGKTEGKSE